MSGIYKIWIKDITFTGKLISYADLITIIFSVWFCVIFILLSISAYRLNKDHQSNKRKITELRIINKTLDNHSQEMEQQAKTDPLTGSLNRGGVADELYLWQSQVKTDELQFSIIFCDIDHFKKVNDTHGHQIGDMVIIDVANLLRAHTRHSDLVVRWGGEEFLLLCPNTSLQAAETMATKLCAQFNNNIWSEKLDITCSFGVGQMQPSEDIESFINRVDHALYKAKENGRNRVEVSQ